MRFGLPSSEIKSLASNVTPDFIQKYILWIQVIKKNALSHS
jgi:hypothetical protein